VDSGIRFKLPVVERVFIVNSKSRLQEDFGFIQYTPPPKPLTEFEEEVAAHQTDVVTEAEQAEMEARNTGNLQQELERGPPLPRDYVVSQNPPPVREPDPQAEAEEVTERVELKAEALENVIPPDGKVPVPEDMKMLTGDLNIVYVTWSVQYEIDNGEDYLFRATDVQRTLRDVAVVAMRIAVGDRLDYEILSTGRDEIALEAKLLMQETLDRYKLGLKIASVIIQDANPPDPVKAAFHMVNRAKQEMENTIHQAEAEYNSILPQTYGKAERLLAEANAYAVELGNRSKGEAARFDAIREEYRKSPQVIRDRYYIEAMEDVYARTAVTLIDPKLKGILPLFQGRGAPTAQMSAESAAVAVAPEMVAPEPLAPVEGQVQVPSKPIPEVGAHTPPQRSVDPPAPQEIMSGNPPGPGTPASARVPPPVANEVAPVNLPAGGTRRAP
jgi:HflK protein